MHAFSAPHLHTWSEVKPISCSNTPRIVRTLPPHICMHGPKSCPYCARILRDLGVYCRTELPEKDILHVNILFRTNERGFLLFKSGASFCSRRGIQSFQVRGFLHFRYGASFFSGTAFFLSGTGLPSFQGPGFLRFRNYGV
jgi:hypothetical protein